jgi:hypothetical protein
MNQGKYVFAQVSSFLPMRIFDRIVLQYEGNKGVRHFTCWNQMMCMIFGQLSGRDSLRDLIITLQAHTGKYYHLGLGKNISRSNLAEVNETRDYRIYESFAYELIAIARKQLISETEFTLSIKENVYAFDSTTINLCLEVFWWASFRKAKGAIKLHTLYDIKTSIPAFVHITPAKVHDVKALDALTFETGGFYILDRAYIDFKRLHDIHLHQAFFVTRTKANLHFTNISSAKTQSNIKCDKTVVLSGIKAFFHYPEKLRLITFYDTESEREFIFLTNNFALAAQDIALLYKYRWRVELFFKWIKQHLKIKAFWGNSANAVKTQVYIALITYTLVALIKNQLKTDLSTYEMLQILSASLFDKTQLNQLFQSPFCQDIKELKHNQLKINLI